MNFDIDDLICSISTPPGVGAIAIVRISGNDSLMLLEKVFKPFKAILVSELQPKKAYYGQILDNDTLIDEVLVTYFKAPHSYTGDDIIEIACHGSQFIQRQILQLLIDKGCRTAKPGEFTMRAFMNGKMDLTQAEAVGDLIHSRNSWSHKAALTQMKGSFSKRLMVLSDKLLHLISLVELELDFSEEDVEFADRGMLKTLLTETQTEVQQLYNSYSAGQVIKSGIPVAIVGQPNAGKSTLLNKILQEERAIVSEIAGTTRDTIEDTIVLDSIEFRFIDTAGLRKTGDTIEKMGIERSLDKVNRAWIVLFLFDSTSNIADVKHAFELVLTSSDTNQHIVAVANKVDLLKTDQRDSKIQEIADSIGIAPSDMVYISAKHEKNIPELVTKLVEHAKEMLPDEDSLIVYNTRQYELLMKILVALGDTLTALENQLTGDLLAFELRKVLTFMGELTGTVISPDMVLGNIFKNFCVGK